MAKNARAESETAGLETRKTNHKSACGRRRDKKGDGALEGNHGSANQNNIMVKYSHMSVFVSCVRMTDVVTWRSTLM